MGVAALTGAAYAANNVQAMASDFPTVIMWRSWVNNEQHLFNHNLVVADDFLPALRLGLHIAVELGIATSCVTPARSFSAFTLMFFENSSGLMELVQMLPTSSVWPSGAAVATTSVWALKDRVGRTTHSPLTRLPLQSHQTSLSSRPSPHPSRPIPYASPCSSSSTSAPRKSLGCTKAMRSPCTLYCGLPSLSTCAPLPASAARVVSTLSTPKQK
jgi:hypothetical protein